MELKNLVRFSRYQTIFNLDELVTLENQGNKPLEEGDELLINISDDVYLYASNGASYSLDYRDEFDEWLRYEYISISIIKTQKKQIICDVFGFSQYLSSDKEWAFAVDDKLIEQIKNGNRSRKYFGLDKESIINTLSTEFVLSAAPGTEHGRFVSAYLDKEKEKDCSFSIVGQKYIAKIQKNDDIFLIISLTEHRNKDYSSLSLVEGKISVIDETLAKKLTTSKEVNAQLQRLDSDNSAYLNIWQEYSAIELKQIEDKKELAGELRYSDCSIKPVDEENLDFYFTIKSEDKSKINKFITIIKEISSSNLSIEAHETLDKKTSSETGFIGLFKQVKETENNKSIIILSTTSTISPPQNGCLRLSLLGDEISHKRRGIAHSNIKSNSTPMPQLRLILENSEFSFTQRQPRTVSDKEINKAFGKKTTPTEQQRKAVRLAITTSDIALIQGPPGTGKTQVISAVLKILTVHSNAENKRYINLLTSFQHDAVDNAVERVEVFGLPAFRLGKKKGQEVFDDSVDSWRKKKRQKVMQTIETIDQPAVYRHLNHIRELITVFQLSPPRLISITYLKLIEIITNIEQLNKEGLSSNPRKLEELRRECFRLKNKDFLLVDTELIRLIRAIRITECSYFDDGVRQIKQLINYIELDETLNNSVAHTSIQFLKNYQTKTIKLCKLEKIKNKLLDTFLPDRRNSEIYSQNNTINDLLQSILDDLNNRVKKIKIGKQDVLEEYRNTLRYSAFEVESLIKNYTSVMATTCQKVLSSQVARELDNNVVFEHVIIDEAARANPLDLMIPMSVARKKIILVGDHRQLPHMLEPKVENELSSQIKQEEQEDKESSLSEDYSIALKQSLFERLWKQQKEKGKEKEKVITLDTQFRMHPILGDFISQSFYEIENDPIVHSGRPSGDFKHKIAKYKNKCAVWLNCDSGKEKKYGFSKYNKSEARKIAIEVRILLEKSNENIGVISFYSAQTSIIENELFSLKVLIKKGNKYILNEQWGETSRLKIGTVDSFQGMEFGIVLLSAVRSNNYKCESDNTARYKKYGHLTLANRLNVAMSRQQKILIVVGDLSMFNTKAAKKYVFGLYKFYQLCRGENGSIE